MTRLRAPISRWGRASVALKISRVVHHKQHPRCTVHAWKKDATSILMEAVHNVGGACGRGYEDGQAYRVEEMGLHRDRFDRVSCFWVSY